jgi:hypothetical protein
MKQLLSFLLLSSLAFEQEFYSKVNLIKTFSKLMKVEFKYA